MLYEMLTGQPPFVGDTINAIMYQTINTAPPPPGTLNKRVPAMLNFIVAKALAKGVDERYQSAKEFADDLRTCLDVLPVAARVEFGAEESKPVANMGLPRHSDSYEATVRMASTTAPEDIEEDVKTLKIPRPSLNAINQDVPQATKAKVVASAATAKTIPQMNQGKRTGVAGPASNRNLRLLVILLLVLLGLIIFL
jgi:serine/threonine-protein kinase